MKDLTALQVLEKLIEHSNGVNVDGHTRIDDDYIAERHNLECVVNKAKIALFKVKQEARP